MNPSDVNPKAESQDEPMAAHPAAPVAAANALAVDGAANLATPKHDKTMASRFLAGLDPNASKFTFQLFSDGAGDYRQIFQGSLDELWPKVLMLNTPQRGVGVFVTINETDFKGRSTNNIVRPRAIFADADSKEQAERCLSLLKACGASPSMAVNSGRGYHFYFCTDVPRDQFSMLQEQLSAKLGTDAAVKDLPRVMRLPGTLHLKVPTKPRLVKLLNSPNGSIQRWLLSDLVRKLGLTPANPVPSHGPSKTANLTSARCDLSKFTDADRERIQKLFGLPIEDNLSAGLETNIEEIRSAVSAIPSSAIATEPEWMKLARALAHEAAVFNKEQAEELWEILDTASQRAPGYDEADNRCRWLRYMDEALDRENPITIDTVFHMALDHGWRWSPPLAANIPSSVVWSAADLKVSFPNIPHRRWLYGVDLVRGDITVVGSPGGAGKTSLAIGMAISIAVGRPLLDQKIFAEDGLRVLYINAEDSGIEMKRRTWAFCLKHNIAEQDLNRLYVAGTDDPHVQRLSFLQTGEKNASVLDPKGFEQLDGLVAALRPDLVVLDPLVALCGGGNINDNAAMSLVMLELKRLAIKYDCAVLIIHHTRKGGDLTTAEAISGASAIVNLARRAIIPVTMTDDEATKTYNVLPSDRFRYLKVIDAKSNLAPRSGDTPWYELCNVELPNPEPPLYPFGDRVQAIARIDIPLAGTASTGPDDQKIRKAILDTVHRGKLIDGQSYPYSPSPAGANNERTLLDDATAAVASATSPKIWKTGDLKTITKRAIAKMKTADWLIEDDVKELMSKPGRFAKARGLKVDWARTPWPDAGVNAGAVARAAAASHDKEGPGLARQIKTSAADRATAAERKARGK
ncbi:MAG: AAA family ATPase [Steroidobacteraceae bacterium]